MSETPSQTITDEADRSVSRKAIAAAAFGNALEWYDFSVYAFFASYIAHNFFRDDDPTMALINTFIVFGAGFVARPLGAVLVGSIGDRRGRKAALMVSIAAMAVGTTILAFAPPISLIGIGAPILLLIGRLFQGFSVGGEIGGAAAFMLEYAPEGAKSRYAAWLQASMGISNLISATVGVAITTMFSDQAVLDWAWRIPFILGIAIVPVGLYIRKQLPETKEFTSHASAPVDRPRHPLIVLFTKHPGALAAGFGFSILWTVCVYAFVIYLPTYYKSPETGLGFTSQQSFIASWVGNVVLVVGCLYAGRLADRHGVGQVLVVSIIAMLVIPGPILMWLHYQQNMFVLILVHCLLCAAVSGFAGVAPSVLPRAFPVPVRSSGLALSYNVAAIFFAGFTPALMTWATREISVYAPVFWVGFGCIACLVCMPYLLKLVSRDGVTH